jgi:phage baseplate assembly protein W
MVLFGKYPPSKSSLQNIASGPNKKRTGLSWPSIKNENSPYFNRRSGKALVVDQIRQYILTTKGERLMLPDYGTHLQHFLFEPFTSDVVKILADDIKQGFAKYIPNASINVIRFFQSENINGFGLPGIQVQVSVTLKESDEIINMKVTI